MAIIPQSDRILRSRKRTAPIEEAIPSTTASNQDRSKRAKRLAPTLKLSLHIPKAPESEENPKPQLLPHTSLQQNPWLEEPAAIIPSPSKSDRVTQLLHNLPISQIYKPNKPSFETILHDMKQYSNLTQNIIATSSVATKRLAWDCFSDRNWHAYGDKRHRYDKQKKAEKVMLKSGIEREDMKAEERGEENDLPEWKKWNTHPQFAGKGPKRTVKRSGEPAV